MKRAVLFALGGALLYGGYRAFTVWPTYAANATATNPSGQLTGTLSSAFQPTDPNLYAAAAAGLAAAWLL